MRLLSTILTRFSVLLNAFVPELTLTRTLGVWRKLARVDPELLSPVQPRSEEALQVLAVVRAREGLVRTRTKLINQIRSTVKVFWCPVAGELGSELARRSQDAIPQELKAALEPLVRVIVALTEEIAGFDRDMETWCEKWPVTKRLRQIRGVAL